jgi:hypothetical protein
LQHGARVTRLRLFTLAANAARATYESAGFAAYEILYEKLVNGRETAAHQQTCPDEFARTLQPI